MTQFHLQSPIEELYRSSFIDLLFSEKDNSVFISVPLSAFLFGKNKLSISPMKSLIDKDKKLLILFGAGQISLISAGLQPRVDNFFREIARVILDKKEKLSTYIPILKFICRKSTSSWLTLATLFEENLEYQSAKNSLHNYLEETTDESKKIGVWKQLALLNKKIGDAFPESHALLEMCEIPGTSFFTISSSVKRINFLLTENKLELNTQERQIIVQRMSEILRNRLEKGEGGLDDYSQLAWLYLHMQNVQLAKTTIKSILEEDPNHYHGSKLAKTLGIQDS